jgi:hypothetical protein
MNQTMRRMPRITAKRDAGDDGFFVRFHAQDLLQVDKRGGGAATGWNTETPLARDESLQPSNVIAPLWQNVLGLRGMASAV